MFVKSKENFEKQDTSEITTNLKKYILRGQRNTRYHEKKLSNKKKPYNST